VEKGIADLYPLCFIFVKIGQSFASMMWPRLQIIEGKQEGIQ
jgi:hypothetical protein